MEVTDGLIRQLAERHCPECHGAGYIEWQEARPYGSTVAYETMGEPCRCVANKLYDENGRLRSIAQLVDECGLEVETMEIELELKPQNEWADGLFGQVAIFAASDDEDLQIGYLHIDELFPTGEPRELYKMLYHGTPVRARLTVEAVEVEDE